jgi:two-component system KDP operon response regulator KdpE
MTHAEVLIVDDDPQIRRTLRATLVPQGYAVSDARSGEEALEKLRAEKADVVLLDLNMPGMGGLATCQEIRRYSDVAIIVLTVRYSETDKVQALDAGADDYITKPFSMPELLARIRAALRRLSASPDAGPDVLRLEGVTIDFAARHVVVRGEESRLTPKELDLLRYLMANANTVIPHRKLLQAIWGPDYGDEVEYLRVFVNHLRKKIEPNPAKPRYLLTEPCVGYRFSLPSKV